MKISHSTSMKHWTAAVLIQPLGGPFYLEAHGQVVKPDPRTQVFKLDLMSPYGLYPGRTQCPLWASSSRGDLGTSISSEFRDSLWHGLCASL